jgi:hypothetical protein
MDTNQQQGGGFTAIDFASQAFRILENARVEYQAGSGILDAVEAAFALSNTELIVMASSGITFAGEVVGRSLGQMLGMAEEGASLGKMLGQMAGEEFVPMINEGMRLIAKVAAPLLQSAFNFAKSIVESLFA